MRAHGDRAGNNAFEGGFLGLDNIGVFDRSSPLPTGGYLEQADGTAWMALFSLNMLEISIELAVHNEAYGDMALKFIQHFCSIASATIHAGGNTGMWDEEDGRRMNLYQVAEEITRRLAGIFLLDREGHRPVNGGARKYQEDPHWRDCIQFYEYFHGDTGAGVGASHQTGWTGDRPRDAPLRNAHAETSPRRRQEGRF